MGGDTVVFSRHTGDTQQLVKSEVVLQTWISN